MIRNIRLVDVMPVRKWFLIVGVLSIIALPVRAEDSPNPLKELSLQTERSFGHSLGDLIRHEIGFHLDKPERLDQASLPRPGPLNDWLELRNIEVAESAGEDRTAYRIDVVYQIFPLIRKSETLEIPGLPLWIVIGDQSRAFASQATRVTIAPLIPAQLTDAEVTIRPAIEPETLPDTIHSRIIILLCATFTLVLGYLAGRRGWLPFFRSNTSPFTSARGQVRRWRNAGPASAEYRNALLAIHRAFNEVAEESLFASGLDGFFHRHPGFEPMREKTGIFFALSEQVFFSETLESANYPVQWLEQLCREFQKIERKNR